MEFADRILLKRKRKRAERALSLSDTGSAVISDPLAEAYLFKQKANL